MHESTVTARGQTTLPRAVRDALGVASGDRIRYVVERGGIRLVKAQRVGRLAGRLRRAGPPVSLEAMDDAVAEEVAARSARR